MKRTLILALALVFAIVLSAFAVSAEGGTALIPETESWTKTDNGGASVTTTYNDDGSIVFSGSAAGTWPCTETWYTDSPVVANVETDSLVIDFTVEGGSTNINFFFDNGSGGSYGYTICNTTLGNVVYDVGSGDLMDGTYKMAIKISELVASTKLLNSEAFPAGAVIDGQLKFIGIQIYSVNGAVVTVNQMDIMPTADVPVESEPESSAPESSAEASSEETVSEEVSSEAESSVAVSEAESSAASAASSAATVSEDDNEGGNMTAIILVAVVAVVAIAAVVVIVIKRKK